MIGTDTDRSYGVYETGNYSPSHTFHNISNLEARDGGVVILYKYTAPPFGSIQIPAIIIKLAPGQYLSLL